MTDGLSIGEAARKLGVSVQALRAWTRRYGYPSFTRTSGGHRRYPVAEIDRLASSLRDNDGMARAATDDARRSADVYVVCPHCRKRVDRLLVRTRRVG